MLPKPLTHHAVLIIGDMEILREELVRDVCDTFQIRTKGNPDFYVEEHDVFGIDESRRIRAFQATAPVEASVKVLLISFSSITNDAQNALLKVIEEPAPSTRFIFVTPSHERMLPTFISRVFLVHGTQEDKNSKSEAKEFLSMDPARRLGVVKKIIESKDKQKAKWFIEGVASCMRSSPLKTKEALTDISKALSYIGDQSSSVKIILEGLSLTLPRIE